MSRILKKICRVTGLPQMLSLPIYLSHILREGKPATSRFSGNFMSVWRQRWLRTMFTLKNSYIYIAKEGLERFIERPCGSVKSSICRTEQITRITECTPKIQQRQWITRVQSCKQEAWASLRSVDSAIPVSSCVILDKWHNFSWAGFSIFLALCFIQLAVQKSQEKWILERGAEMNFFLSQAVPRVCFQSLMMTPLLASAPACCPTF